MSERLLTVDLGNSRIKARAWSVQRDGLAHLESARDERSEPAAVERLAEWIAELGELHRAALSAVGARELESSLAAILRARCPAFVERVDAGVELALRSPETAGADRLFAARGAFEHFRVSTLVVSAGTALTVDAVRVTERSARPVFLGGAIAPGPELLARSMATGGARLFGIQPRPGVRALGRDTREALEAGVAVGFEGAATRLVERVGAESGIAAPVVLTGGAAAFLERILHGAVHVPDLVHHGMLAALGVGLPRPARQARP